MADAKISALPAATIPLAGTEILPIVQGGVTDKVSVANLTAGRDTAVKKLNATDNVVIGTAGKGIDFGANSHTPGMTSELLDWYEEGTWTGALTCGTSGTITLNASFQTGSYTRIGRLVTVTGLFLVDSVSSPLGTLFLAGLPFAISNSGNEARTAAAVCAFTLEAPATTSIVGRGAPGASQIEIYKFAAGTISDLAADVKAGSQFYVTMSYIV